MNDFDRFLELKLRQMLDPVVAEQPPARRRAKRSPKPVLAVLPPPDAIEILPGTVLVPVRVASGSQL